MTYVFYKNGVETFVIRPGFTGKVDEFCADGDIDKAEASFRDFSATVTPLLSEFVPD